MTELLVRCVFGFVDFRALRRGVLYRISLS